MYIATKNITTDDKIIFKGQEVPEKFISPHLIQIGAVVRKEVTPEASEIKDAKPHKTEKKEKPQILTEDSSKVEIVKEIVKEK